MSRKYLDLLCDLLAVDSPTSHEREACLLLHGFMRDAVPYDSLVLQEVVPGRYNIILRRGKPRVTLMSHIDTVPGRIAVGETATTISGRGACDAKGQIAAQLCAIDRASAAGATDYACVFVVGEEVDSIGAIAASGHPDVNSEFLLVGEPTENAFVSRTRGVVECRITHRQPPPASAAPVDAAIDDLLDDLKRALEPSDAGDMVNIGTIRGGSPPSVAAAGAEADICIRFSDASLLALERLRMRLRRAALEVTSPPIEPFDFHVPEGAARVEPMVAFCSDAPLFARKFERIMLFGPGSIAHAHTETEHIDKADWLEATDVLTTLLTK